MKTRFEKFEGGRRILLAMNSLQGERLWFRISEIIQRIRFEDHRAVAAQEPIEFEIDDVDRTILAVAWELTALTRFFIPFNEFEPFFDRTIDALKFVIENGCTSIEQVPDFEELRADIKRFQEETLAMREYRRPDDWEPDH